MMEKSLAAGFEDSVFDAQSIFRAVLQAMSNPGQIVPAKGVLEAPEPLPPVMASIALSLLDYETPFWLSPQLNIGTVSRYLAFHTGATLISEAEEAAFLLVFSIEELPSLMSLRAGTPEYPDQSATVFLSLPSFEGGLQVCLSGPGINGKVEFAPSGLGDAFWDMAKMNHSRFPLGVDYIFCGTDGVAALPRSTSIETRT